MACSVFSAGWEAAGGYFGAQGTGSRLQAQVQTASVRLIGSGPWVRLQCVLQPPYPFCSYSTLSCSKTIPTHPSTTFSHTLCHPAQSYLDWLVQGTGFGGMAGALFVPVWPALKSVQMCRFATFGIQRVCFSISQGYNCVISEVMAYLKGMS